jgi:hypothetical protein
MAPAHSDLDHSGFECLADADEDEVKAQHKIGSLAMQAMSSGLKMPLALAMGDLSRKGPCAVMVMLIAWVDSARDLATDLIREAHGHDDCDEVDVSLISLPVDQEGNIRNFEELDIPQRFVDEFAGDILRGDTDHAVRLFVDYIQDDERTVGEVGEAMLRVLDFSIQLSVQVVQALGGHECNGDCE